MVSHDLVDGFVPKNDMAQCNLCRKFKKETITCQKYGEWIPKQKPVGACPDFEPDEQKVKEQEAWKKEVRKMTDEMVARAKNRQPEKMD